MYDTCRHIMPTGKRCGSPAVKNTLFCFHHTNTHKLTRRRARYGSVTIPFVFPEDRASLQTNFFLVLRALAEGQIDNQTSNSMTRTLRACSLNLAKGPLVEASTEDTVQRIILTPDGEEIAPPREALEKDETLAHGPDCPCRKCAEQYRNVQPEQHHAQCQCGLCESATDTDTAEPSILNPELNSPAEDGASVMEVSDVNSVDKDQSNRSEGAHVAAAGPSVGIAEASGPKNAAATRLCEDEPTLIAPKKDAKDNKDSLYDYESVRQIYWARQAAIEAGQEPPPWPSDAAKKTEPETNEPQPVPDYLRRYNETMAQVEKNKQIADEIWRRRYPEEAAKEAAASF